MIPYRSGSSLSLVPLNILSNFGGLGDQVARLPAVKYLLTHYPHVDLHYYVQDYFKDYAQAVLPYSERLKVFKQSEWEQRRKGPTIDFTPMQITSMKRHLTQHGFDVMLDLAPQAGKYFDYLKSPHADVFGMLYHVRHPFVVVTTGFTSKSRQWKAKEINKAVKLFKTAGYDIVFLGKHESDIGTGHIVKGNFDETIDYSQGVDLIDKTSLIEAANVMGQAAGVIGVDNGLLHLACTTDVPVVFGFTTVDPQHRLPYRNGLLGWNTISINPPQSLECRHCQSRQFLMYNHDYKRCLYDDYKCLDAMKGEAFFNAFLRLTQK